MRQVTIQLYGSHGCLLDSQQVRIAEGEDTEDKIGEAMLAFIGKSVLSPGDQIRISEEA
jgi:hypothetical protein